MRSRPRLSHFVATAAVALLVSACDSPSALQPEGGPALSRGAASPQAQLLKEVRQATARFHSTTQAVQAGYSEDTHCVPQMGFHWVNFGAVDEVFDPLQPEVVIYAPGPNGQPKLVAVEYLVVDVGQDHPTFAGHPLDVGGAPLPFDHWSLHVWLYEDNPNGVFTPFNPAVSCS